MSKALPTTERNTMQRQPAFRSHDHAVQLDETLERIRAQYIRACETHRYGSTPAIREAARLTAMRLRPAVHPQYAEAGR